jgi:hypothetical protein
MTQLGELLNAQPELRAQEVLEQQLGQPTAIAHTDGDEKRPAFWRMLVNSDPQSLIAKETAIFAIRIILLELQGLKARRAEIDFAGDPVTLGEMFALLEKLSGSAGWKLSQSKAGYAASS